MNLYVRAQDRDFGDVAWLYHDGDQSFLTQGGLDSFYDTNGEPAVLPAKSVKEAKRWMREAEDLMLWGGATRVKVSCWRFVRGHLTETKFTRDNKIKH